MASMTFKEVQRLQGVQRGSKASKALTSIEVVDHEERYPGSTTKKKMKRSRGVLQKCNTFSHGVADVQQCGCTWYYSMWHSDTA